MRTLSMILAELKTPDDNRRNWYAELTNQCGHTLLGAILAGLFCAVWRAIYGEMPYLATALFVVLVPYFAFELVVQGRKDGDSWFDSAMVALGACVITCFREAGVDGDVTFLQFNHNAFLKLCAAWFLLLSFRVSKRIVASGRQT